MITGIATQEGTLRLAQANPLQTYNQLGSFGVWISQVGYGAYRIEESDERHHQSLCKSILEGINLIDTSAMYTNGSSEKVIGNVLSALISEEKIAREQVVVISKAGIVQGEDYQLSIAKGGEEAPYPDWISTPNGFSLCIHPEYLEDQLTRSLERLQLSTLDGYLLHNPEYYLMWAKMNKVDEQEASQEFLRRMELAFRHLEQEVERGRIQCYGVSSNTFPIKSTEYEFTPLEKLWEIAESISPNHHFKIVQFPFNLIETGAFLEKNQTDNRGVLQFTQEKQLGVITNRSFDVIQREKAFRLTEVKWDPAQQLDDKKANQLVMASIEEVEEAEDVFIEELLPALELAEEEQKKIRQKVTTGILIRKYWKKLYSSFNVKTTETSFFLPAVDELENLLAELGKLDAPVQAWISFYRATVVQTIEAMNFYYMPKDYQRVQEIKQQVAQLDPAWGAAETLSQLAVRILRATPEVHCALVGMRRENYVEDVLAELRKPLDLSMSETEWQKLTDRLQQVI
ncbi:aldo/keto reductase [Brevibacillus dissolubilis]|uniref:aldo/keto reductase n=1 Tax=Brevibacillus dissolubilis TaxID=1844116 RepID=UPI001116A42A|nr:aldo/keto reductase [Brevibacillus dissolubilis]